MDRAAHEKNRCAWDRMTPVHNAHKVGQAGYLREGGSTLYPDEVALLGDVSGLDVLHVCCNGGPDTLSIAALGARAVGVDISGVAIEAARALSAESGIAATFLRADVYDALDELPPACADVVFASYGALGWLSDLPALLRGVARALRPGGRWVMLEFHPIVFTFDDDGEPFASYFLEGGIEEADGLGDYVGASGASLAPMGFREDVGPVGQGGPTVSYAYTVADFVQAAADAGLRVSRLVEYPYSNGWRPFDGARPLEGRRWGWPEGRPTLPMMLGLVAEKPRD
jgi:SAM-dependent methyltransferase